VLIAEFDGVILGLCHTAIVRKKSRNEGAWNIKPYKDEIPTVTSMICIHASL
jgi:hypothetical protein